MPRTLYFIIMPPLISVPGACSINQTRLWAGTRLSASSGLAALRCYPTVKLPFMLHVLANEAAGLACLAGLLMWTAGVHCCRAAAAKTTSSAQAQTLPSPMPATAG